MSTNDFGDARFEWRGHDYGTKRWAYKYLFQDLLEEHPGSEAVTLDYGVNILTVHWYRNNQTYQMVQYEMKELAEHEYKISDRPISESRALDILLLDKS